MQSDPKPIDRAGFGSWSLEKRRIPDNIIICSGFGAVGHRARALQEDIELLSRLAATTSTLRSIGDHGISA
ncbi:unnamed protein product [Lasius platythorax]|uniref:Uncharacterized protein n=1 Tax=Lasius platythorax TaxID=488582 RepID=A0AAV2P1Y8_9HYME